MAMNLGKEDTSQRMEHGTVLNKMLADHHIDVLPSGGNIAETEQVLTLSDVSGDLLEIFETQQTVHLVDLMPADQKSRALASMCGLLSQKLPESSGAIADQPESGDYPGRKNTAVLSLCGDDIPNVPPASLLQSDPEDNSQTASSNTTERVHPESHLSSIQTEQITGVSSSDETTERQPVIPKHQTGIKREDEGDVTVADESYSNYLKGASDEVCAARFRKVGASCLSSSLPPKKRNRGRQGKALSLNAKESEVPSSAVAMSKTSQNVICTDINPTSVFQVNQPSLRRSTRKRKVSIRVAEFLGPETNLLKSTNKSEKEVAPVSKVSNKERPDTSVSTIKRGRGRPRKNSSQPSLNTDIKAESKEWTDCSESCNKESFQKATSVDNEQNVDNVINSVSNAKPVISDQEMRLVNGNSSHKREQSNSSEQTSSDPTSGSNRVSDMGNENDSTEVIKDNKHLTTAANHSPHTLSDDNKYSCTLLNKTEECNTLAQGCNQAGSEAINRLHSDSDSVGETDPDATMAHDPGIMGDNKPAVIKVESKAKNFAKTEIISLHSVNQYIVKENNKYRCTICNKLANYKANLKVHLRIHSGERPFRCKICDKSFAASNNLQRHINETHEKRRPLICETCGQGCFTMKSLARHQLKKHSPEEEKKKPNFTCETCGKCFKWRSDLKDHSVKHTNTMPFKCETCGRAFTFLNNLRRHRKIHKDYRPHRCNQCGKRFIEPRCLRLHINRIHLGIDIKPQGEPKYSCEICNKPFYMKSWLELHMLSHTGHKPHACEICEKRFSLKANLKRHMLIHTGENPFPCTECTKKFKSRRALKLHLMIHRNEKPFMCDACNKGFTNSSALKEHRLIHDSQPKFFCSTCNQTFLRSSHLHLHMERHEGKPRHACDKCDGKFFRKCDLNRHLLKHSSVKPYGCAYCDKRFTRRQYLNNHVRVNHPALGRNDHTRSILLQVMPSQDLSRPIFRIVSKQNVTKGPVISEPIDVSTLLKLNECSKHVLSVTESSINETAQGVMLSCAHTIPPSAVSESITFDTAMSSTASATNEDLGAMSKTVISSHPDPLQQATRMLFESEDECQDVAVMTSNGPVQYMSVQEEFSAVPSGLTTLVNVAAREHLKEAETEHGNLGNERVVLTVDDSDHVVMVTNTEDASFISESDFSHLDVIHLKNESGTSNIQQTTSQESFDQNAAGIGMYSSSGNFDANVLSSNLKMSSDAPLVEIDSSSTEQHSNEAGQMTLPENVAGTRDVLNVQHGEHVFRIAASNSFSSSLESDGLVLGPYAQVIDQNTAHEEAQYGEVVMLNGERMQLLIQSPDTVHNIEVQHGSDVQVIDESMLRRSNEINQNSSVKGGAETPKESHIPQSEIIFQPENSQKPDSHEPLPNFDGTTEGQYLVILKE